ncbi:MAG: hypothetical protein ACJ8G1_24975 [Vitreoscilla sp.]
MIAFTRALPVALVAAGMLLAAHGAQAASTAADVARVDTGGQLPLREACPDVDTRDLADELADTWDDAAKPSTVEVSFKVRRQHVYDVQPATASPRTWHAIRRAVHDLRCDGGDDQPHAVRFVVRYVDATHVATTMPASARR